MTPDFTEILFLTTDIEVLERAIERREQRSAGMSIAIGRINEARIELNEEVSLIRQRLHEVKEFNNKVIK